MDARRVDEGSREAAAAVALVFRKFRREYIWYYSPYLFAARVDSAPQIGILENNNSKYRQNDDLR
jgi:hypothetical protein